MYFFATYFDSRYISRGLALLQSLGQHSSKPFKLFILCLDEKAFEVLCQTKNDSLVPVSLSALMESDAMLKEVSASRQGADLIFTYTPCFIRYLFQEHQDIDLLTYLDADMFFFDDPAYIFEEIGDRSIAMVPHKFSDRNYSLREYGIFNVGWVSWRRDAPGLACLDDYRQNCLDWCHDEIDGTRFADQRYLDQWPSRYDNVCVISQKGANVAPWNLDLLPFSHEKGVFRVGGDPLVFYHFHKFSIEADGSYKANLESYVTPESDVDPAMVERLYRPYADCVAAYMAAGETVGKGARHAAPVIPDHPERMLPPLELLSITKADKKLDIGGIICEGIQEYCNKQKEDVQRQMAIPSAFGINPERRAGYLWHVSAIAYELARRGEGPFKVLEWGVSTGAAALALKHHFRNTGLEFETISPLMGASFTGPDAVHETAPETQLLHEGLQPVDSIKSRYSVVIVASSLQYAADWQACFRALLRTADGSLIIYDEPFVSAVPSYRMIRRMYGDCRQTTAKAWAINIVTMEKIARDEGFEIGMELPLKHVEFCKGASEHPEVRGFILRKLKEQAHVS